MTCESQAAGQDVDVSKLEEALSSDGWLQDAAVQAALASVKRRLSPPEDVARDVDALESLFTFQGPSADELSRFRVLRDRLATAAARVPGLEAELEAARAELADLGPEVERLTKRDGDLCASLSAVEAERDAARQEAAQERAARLVWERMVEALRVLLGLDSTTTIVATVECLRARVAELERERDAARKERNEARRVLKLRDGTASALKDSCTVWMKRAEEAEARATAAEAKVKAIEAAVVATVGGQVEGQPTSTVNYLQRLRALVAAESQPTPAPGLREAVEEALDAHAVMMSGEDDGDPSERFNAAMESLRAAYDATPPAVTHVTEQTPECATCPERGDFETLCCKAGPHIVVDAATSVTHAQLAAVVEAYEAECGALAEPLESDDPAFLRVAGNAEGAREVLRRATGGKMPETREEGDLAGLLALLTRPNVDTLLRVETEGGRLFGLDGSEMREMAEKAAKWDAALERAKDADRLHASWYGLNVKEDVVQSAVRYVLGLTLPTGPGGGEDYPHVEADDGSCALTCPGCLQEDDPVEIEARNPRVTPEVPALAESTICPGCQGDDYCSCPEVLPAAPATVDADVAANALVSSVTEAARLAAEAQRTACANAVLAGPAGVEESRGDVYMRVLNARLVTK